MNCYNSSIVTDLGKGVNRTSMEKKRNLNSKSFTYLKPCEIATFCCSISDKSSQMFWQIEKTMLLNKKNVPNPHKENTNHIFSLAKMC